MGGLLADFFELIFENMCGFFELSEPPFSLYLLGYFKYSPLRAIFMKTIGLTQQFGLCGNAFRLDSSKGCFFQCAYCFANNRKGVRQGPKEELGDLEELKRYFQVAFEGRPRESLTSELLKRRVPLHFGGMSDPANDLQTTNDFLQLLRHYDYPAQVSTKGTNIRGTNPEILGFQVSLSFMDQYNELEPHAPSPKERIQYIKDLKKDGYWVGVRIQPMIDINQAYKVIDTVGHLADFISFEHLGIPRKSAARDTILRICNLDLGELESHRVYWEFPYNRRLENTLRILEYAKGIEVGVGDNDLFLHSTTLNCCGLDTMGPKFKYWLKYNVLYILKTQDRTVWSPRKSVLNVLNSHQRVSNLKTVKDYVDHWLGGYDV